MDILRAGDLEVLGRMPWSSNQTFLARVEGEVPALCVYKPRQGERPLWDFPTGSLCDRELATFLVSEALGWAIVPPTLVRDGPFGEGMVQLFIDHDPDEHYLTLQDSHEDRFRQFAALDFVVNNADRKAGHCLLASDGHVWGIDHGLTFHTSPKLRTVIWDFAGDRLDREIRSGLERLATRLDGDLGAVLNELLSTMEAEATARRLEALLRGGTFPQPRGDYPFPWPMV